MTRLVVFGDSITWGAWDEAGGWVQRLRTDFDTKTITNNPANYTGVYNCGVSGDTVEDILKRFDAEMAARFLDDETNYILFSIGINDSQFLVNENRGKFSEDEFEKNITELAERAKNYTDKIGFLGLNPINEALLNPMPWAPDKAYHTSRVEIFNQVIQNFCTKNDLLFIDIWQSWIDKDYIAMLPDGVHPNAAGHDLIYQAVAERLSAAWGLDN